MSDHYTTYCLEVGKYELDCDVDYQYTPGDPGVRYYPDGSGCPPTPPEIEILGVSVEGVLNDNWWEWVKPDDPRYPCLVYPSLDRAWLEDRGWAGVVDEIARRELDNLAAGDSDFYYKLVYEAERERTD